MSAGRKLIFIVSYFEKLRIKEGKPKSKHRLEMEEVWSHKGGLNTSRPGSTSRGYVSILALFFP